MSALLRALGARRELGVLVALLIAVAAFPNRMPGALVTLGLLSGITLALHAVGVMLIYQSDRIINFAQVQIGAIGATFFVVWARYMPVAQLVRRFCPACLEQIGPGFYRWNYVAGAVIGVLISTAVGWLTSVLLIRRFARAPRLTATVATLFLVPLLGVLQRLMATYMVTTEQREALGGQVSLGSPVFPSGATVRWGPAVFGLQHLLIAVLAVAGIAGVWLFLRRTAPGASLRAVADAPDRASTLGLDVARTKNMAWLVAGALSGIAGVTTAFVAPAAQAGSIGVATVVRILAVVVLARMTSLWIAVWAALTLAVFENGLDWSFSAASLLDGLLLLVIGAVLLLQRDVASRAERAREAVSRFAAEVRALPNELRGHPTVRAWSRGGALVLAAFLLGFPWIMSPSELSLGTAALLSAMIGLSLLILTGWAGQLSLGHMAFAGIGAYIAAVSRAPFPVAIVLGACAGALVALVVGVPALRLRGLQLGMTTLAMSLATSALLFDARRLGRFLPSSLQRPRALNLDDDRAFYYFVLVLLAGLVVAIVGLRRSRFARVLIAARDNDQAAEAYAIPVVRVRLQAFAMSGFIAAFAGSILVYLQYGLRADTYSPEQSLYVFLWTVIGGLGATAGPLIGAAARGVVDIFANNQLVQLLAGGVGGVVLLVMVPGGLARVFFDARDGMLRRLAQRERIVVPSLVADVRTGDAYARAEIAAVDGAVPARYRLDGQWALPAPEDPEPVRG